MTFCSMIKLRTEVGDFNAQHNLWYLSDTAEDQKNTDIRQIDNSNNGVLYEQIVRCADIAIAADISDTLLWNGNRKWDYGLNSNYFPR